jgi:hypothetical protein
MAAFWSWGAPVIGVCEATGDRRRGAPVRGGRGQVLVEEELLLNLDQPLPLSFLYLLNFRVQTMLLDLDQPLPLFFF